MRNEVTTEKVVSPEKVRAALKAVKANGGSPEARNQYGFIIPWELAESGN